MSRTALISDAGWARIEPLLPSSDWQRGRPFRDHRQVIEDLTLVLSFIDALVTKTRLKALAGGIS
jgi:transposase